METKILPHKALAIVAHPDDIEYFCGGLLALWRSNGCEISYLITSSGEKGTNNINEDLQKLQSVRELEQRLSAEIIGVSDITFLHYPDSELSFVDLKQLRGEFVKHIRRVQPDVVLTHDPFVRTLRQHPDHRIVGQLVLDSCFPISSIMQCYKEQITEEGLSTCQPEYVLMFGTDSANYYVNIESTIDIKINSLQQHNSQEDAFKGGIEKRIRWKARRIGESQGYPYAEEFLVVKTGASLPDDSPEEE